MNKNDLLKKISDTVDLTKMDIEKVINCLVDTIIEEVKNGEKVTVGNLGSFEKTIRSARVGINPSTKAKIEIPEKGAPKFKATKFFKNEVA